MILKPAPPPGPRRPASWAEALGHPILDEALDEAIDLVVGATADLANLGNARMFIEVVAHSFAKDDPEHAWRMLRTELLPNETLVQRVAATLLAGADMDTAAHVRTRPSRGVWDDLIEEET